MTMTRKEQAIVEGLINDLALAKALRWRTEPLPARMTTEGIEPYSGLKKGWNPGFWMSAGAKAGAGCFSRISHSIGDTARIASQGIGEFYPTKLEALLVIRDRATLKCAELLASIDRQIEEERKNPTPLPGKESPDA